MVVALIAQFCETDVQNPIILNICEFTVVTAYSIRIHVC